MHMPSGRWKMILSSLCAFLLGGLCLLLVQKIDTDPHACHKQFDLLNPHLSCSDSIQQGEWDFEPLRDTLNAKVAEFKDTHKVSHISIYFRDLNHGPRFGIGEYDKFQPASLLKLPVMIALLHDADRAPSLLDRTLTYSGSIDVNQNTEGGEESIQPNTPYTIRELLTKMIVYSDNYSYKILTHELNTPSPVGAYLTFRDLDVLSMMLAPKANIISIQSYSNLFAVLYNTGYLSKESSQFALELLAKSTFTDGLVDGVPQGVRVAHKFGHRILDTGEDQLHDCGIVYHPTTTYILCVMTSGADFPTEESVVADVSRVVYDGVSSISFRNQNIVSSTAKQ